VKENKKPSVVVIAHLIIITLLIIEHPVFLPHFDLYMNIRNVSHL